MASKITLLVHADFAPAALVKLVESIDEQTLRYDDFDVVFVAKPDSGASNRLQHLAQRRPNIQVIAGTADPGADLVAAAHQAAGDWVLPVSAQRLGPDARLLPESLSQLAAFADEHDADLIAARHRSARAQEAAAPWFRSDAARVAASDAAEVLGSPVVLHRTAFARTHGFVTDEQSAVTAAAVTDQIAVLSHYPVMATVQVAGATNPAPAPELAIDSAEWENGVLLVRTQIPTDTGGRVVGFGLAHPFFGLEFWLPRAESDLGSTRIDVRTAADGAPLVAGRWVLFADVAGESATVRRPLGGEPPAKAIVGDTLVVPHRVDQTVVLDVGAVSTSVCPTTWDPGDIRIAESAGGALLTAGLPDVHVSGHSTHSGSLLLGRFRLPAQIVSDAGSARLECFLSGIAGTSPVSTQFGGAPAFPTGLSLVISTVGELSLIPTPPPPPPTPTDPAATKTPQPPAPDRPAADRPAADRPAADRPAVGQAPAGQPAAPHQSANASLVTKVRRRVPAPLEPAVRRLARNPLAKRAYRKLIGR